MSFPKKYVSFILLFNVILKKYCLNKHDNLKCFSGCSFWMLCFFLCVLFARVCFFVFNSCVFFVHIYIYYVVFCFLDLCDLFYCLFLTCLVCVFFVFLICFVGF